MKIRRYLLNVATGFDVLGNVILGGNPHETISDHAAFARSKGRRWGCVVCRMLGWVNPGHCDRALHVLEVPLIEQFNK